VLVFDSESDWAGCLVSDKRPNHAQELTSEQAQQKMWDAMVGSMTSLYSVSGGASGFSAAGSVCRPLGPPKYSQVRGPLQ